MKRKYKRKDEQGKVEEDEKERQKKTEDLSSPSSIEIINKCI